jgi:hypothetical protein
MSETSSRLRGDLPIGLGVVAVSGVGEKSVTALFGGVPIKKYWITGDDGVPQLSPVPTSSTAAPRTRSFFRSASASLARSSG